MFVFQSSGECGFSGVLTSITAATKINSLLINPPMGATHYVRYSTGATAALRTGEVLTGGTSSATVLLVGQAVESGTAGAGDAGILLLRILSGVPTAAGEVWTGVSTGTVTTAQAPLTIKTNGQAKALLLTVETAAINFTMDGSNPSTAATTNIGHYMTAGSSFEVTGWDNVKTLSVINTVAGSGAVVKYSVYF